MEALMSRPHGAPTGVRFRLMGDSFLYAGPGHDSQSCRHSVSLLCAVGDADVEVRTEGRNFHGAMLMVAPLLQKTLLASGVPFVLMDAEPSHPHFRVLAAACRANGVEPLPEAASQPLLAMARGFHAGTLGGVAVDRAARTALDVLASAWPAPPPLDPRVQQMQMMMDLHPAITLGQMADRLGLTVSTASRLFSRDMGLPQRIYSLAIKMRAAARHMGSGLSMTEIGQDAGFVDSAHFAKVWTRCYGAPPSVFFPPNRVAMDNAGLPDWERWILERHRATEPAEAPDVVD